MDNIRREVRNILKEILIQEEMNISSNFIKNNFIEQDNAIVLEVGIDDENETQHRLNLVLSIKSPNGYNELSFYFNLTNKENTEITSNPKSIYDRKIAKKYLPKELVGKNVFMNKLKEMLEELMKMKLPEKFFMETFEDHKNRKQIDYYDNLVKIITDNGYFIESQGVNPITKKYAWQFLRKDLNKPLSEEVQKHWNGFDEFMNIPRDDSYYKKREEYESKIMENILKNTKL